MHIRIFLISALCCIAAFCCTAAETLHYKITYKWGLIQKQAGTATFTMSTNGTTSKAVMTARTDPWADHIYSVRDTLISVFDAKTRLPKSYHRIAHEDGDYALDIVDFHSQLPVAKATCSRTRRKKKAKETTTTRISLEASGGAVDLLSSVYYLRNLDFKNLKPGYAVNINIFSGKRKENLAISYVGEDEVKLDNTTFKAYKVKFRFTSEGKKKTSEPIEAWLSKDSPHIPLKVVGELKIGKVQCIYIPK